jgi:voltage-gated potassium channel
MPEPLQSESADGSALGRQDCLPRSGPPPSHPLSSGAGAPRSMLPSSAALRRRTHEILEKAQPNDRASRICDFALIALISANVVAVIMESIPATGIAYKAWFDIFEAFSVAVFSVEYLARVWSCVDASGRSSDHPVIARVRYMLTPMALIDLLVVLPFYLGFFVSMDLWFMRVVRLMRLFKMARYFTPISLLLKVLREEARFIVAALFILSRLLVLASSLAYLAEHRIQPEVFGSIPDAMWWAIITMTTVGYGDVTPVTVTGKIIASCIGVIGLGMVALPAGLLASGFIEELRRRRMEYQSLVQEVLSDQVVTNEEERRLEESRIALGLSEERAADVMGRETRRSGGRSGACPHCGAPLERGTAGAPGRPAPATSRQ